MNDKYLASDWRSLELHRLIATRVQNDPSLIQNAIENIDRWKRQNHSPQPYFDDWLEHINKGMTHLITFMLSETDEAQRLRSSSPFVGDSFITQAERDAIFEQFKNR